MYFKLSDSFIEDYKGKQPDWGYGALSYVTYKRSYARPLDPENPKGPTEEYWQTCQRVVEGTFELQKRHIRLMGARWDYVKAQKTAQQMFKFMWEFKFLPPGRGLWAMGTTLVMDRGNGAVLYNCSFRSTEYIDADFSDPFCFLFEASAHGVGVGFDTKGTGKVTIIEPRKGKDTFVVEDSREGWSALLRRILDAYVGKGSIPAQIDYSQVRPAGAPIKSFGGTASGPEALQELIETDIPDILKQMGKITSTQIVDIMNVIGKCVVAGGARRSSEIALGDIEDKEFRDLKLDTGKLEAYRWNSNNSVVVPPFYGGFEEFVDPIMNRGEPGFFFIDNARNFDRLSDSPTYSDMRVLGTNPCAEMTLEDAELCNIPETFPARCDSKEEYLKVLKIAYLYGKTVTLTNTPWPKSNEVMLRNRRVGVSMTGITQNINKLGFAEHIRWCREGYAYIQELDLKYSEWLCVRESIKTTTCKPSGSVSLLSGSTPGIHYPHAEYYIRRVRFNKSSPLLAVLEKANYPIEQDVYDKQSMVVSFPIHEQNFFRGKKDVTIWEQLENAAQMQAHWSDNSVSITVDVKPHEAKDIPVALDRYQFRLKTVSFLPTDAGDYKQPPYEEITREEYERVVERLKELDLSSSVHEITDKFCDGDLCQLT